MTNRALPIAVVLLLVSSLAVGAVSAADETNVEAADLIVEQPDYVEDDVDEQSDDGTPVYIVNGTEQAIYPQNFDAENVTDYGTTSGVGALSYEDDLDRYELDPDGETGSFELFWVVEREAGNETEIERYEAVVRVDDLTSVTVLDTEEANELRDDAAEWREWNATVTEVRESGIIGHAVSQPQSNQDTMQSMVNAYLTMRSPTHLLDGGFTAGVIIMTTTLGGIALFVLLKVPDVVALRRIYGDYFQSKSVRQKEGDVAERQEQVDLEARLQRFANVDWQDLPSVTDHEAAELRKWAETPLEGLPKLLQSLAPETMKADRVRAMGQCGYVAQVDRAVTGDDVAADGGEGVIEHAQLVHTDDVLGPDEQVRDYDDLVELDDPSETLLDAIADDDQELLDFELVHAEFDASEIDEPLETMSLPTLIDELGVSDWAFEDDERVGEIMVEFVESIDNHPITDDDGHFDGVRVELERLLQILQAADDRYQVPTAKLLKQHVERALAEYDHDDELRAFLEDHRGRTDD